ncbi:hypothetical protein, partial [uncultured Rikenella sp.]|uniref:hypothetical protein n=1 Tax=uncultured Rikenella sp. TaxID=368003 RepID=UPI0026203592
EPPAAEACKMLAALVCSPRWLRPIKGSYSPSRVPSGTLRGGRLRLPYGTQNGQPPVFLLGYYPCLTGASGALG